MLLALTFTTGIVDATCILALGGVFAAMMTGNVIFLGLGISGGFESSAVGPLVALAAYIAAGAGAAALAARTAGPAFGTPPANAVETGLLAMATLVALTATVEPDEAGAYAILALLAAAMAWRATNVRALGSENVPTTVLNLFVIAPGSARGLAGVGDLAQRAAAFAALLAGAVAGGLLLEVELWVPLATATALSVVSGAWLARESL